MRIRRALGGLAVAVLAGLAGSCGNGSNPDFPPEVIYRVSAPRGEVTFRLIELRSGRRAHTVPASRTFTIGASDANFLLANAPAPYRGVFQWVSGGGEAEVVAIAVQAPNAERRILSAANPCVVIDLLPNAGDEPLPPTPSCSDPVPEQPGDEVRFEVCAPITSEDRQIPCQDSVTGVDSISGRQFTGTVGDLHSSFVIQLIDPTSEETEDPVTPMVVFMENAEHTVSGVFRGAEDQELRAEMYINDNLADVSTGRNEDLVLKDDL
jgi:hypothetical protein